MIKGQITFALQVLQLCILSTAALFNYFNLRAIRKQVDTYMDTMSTQTATNLDEYPISRCEHFYVIDPKEPHVIPISPK